MQAIRSAQQEAAEDIFFGQAVLIWARWFLIVAGAILVLWRFDDKDSLISGTIPVVALMAPRALPDGEAGALRDHRCDQPDGPRNH